ncbi:Hypothetical protein, putative [Bodo saltans]|uniref:Myotubularin phosphatase domain-containing protein n=1 Tax=Bodo saltans TaxID=75058 RepID=A0A0S4JSB0_BODSA|nr:Hypothetical protein, putative [Bodo saltans]|eukprot:CUG94410.1 Hypothetical protein, putative [Bodo saltans]
MKCVHETQWHFFQQAPQAQNGSITFCVLNEKKKNTQQENPVFILSMAQPHIPQLHLPNQHREQPSLSSEGTSAGDAADDTSTEQSLSPSNIISVSYARFDTRLGNTIAYTYPPSVDLASLVDAKNLQDYCFPDGAHGNMTDTVCATLRRRPCSSASGPSEQQQLHSTSDEGSDANVDDREAYSATFGAVPEGGPIFAFSLYHQKRDASADRGATQRGILILSSQPLCYALQQLAKFFCVPFFDLVPMSEVAAHEMFARALHVSLAETFSVKTGRAEWNVQPKSRITEAVDCALDKRGTMLMSMDKLQCDQRVIRIQMEVVRNDPVTDPHFVRRQVGDANPQRRQRHTSTGDHVHDSHNGDNDDRDDVLFSSELVLPVPLPRNGATLTQQLAFGASLKKLMAWFGGKIAIIHWCIPVMMIGDSASDVSDAVRACILLMQPFDIDVVRFAPYCTLEHVDYFSANMSSSVYLALGATNAYVCHKDFPGAAKCDLRNGKVTFADNGKLASLKHMPKTHPKSFDDLCAAATDPAVAECYIRARCARFNVAIAKQVLTARSGNYYDALCRISNILEQPLDASVRGTIRHCVPRGGGGLNDGGDRASVPADVSTTSAAANDDGSGAALDRDATDSGFLLVDDETTTANRFASPAAALPRNVTGSPPSSPTRSEPSEALPAVDVDANDETTATTHAAGSPDIVEQMLAGIEDSPLSTGGSHHPLTKEDGATTSTPDARRNKLLRDLSSAINMFDEYSKRNHQMIVDVDKWYKDMCHVIHTIAGESEPWHEAMVSELASFSAMNELPPDPSVCYCPSELTGGCTSQQQWDRTQRLRIVQDYKERVFLMVDAISKNNSRALFRKTNRYMADFFHFAGSEGYAIPAQVLLHHTSCKTVWYVQKTKVSAGGSMFLTKNYLLFEAGSFSIRKRHQIVPFDCIRSVAKDRTSAFSTSVKVLIDIPVDAATTSAATSPAVLYHQGLLVITDVHASEGFYQLLHALTHRQRRLVKLMEHFPAPHTIPSRIPLNASPSSSIGSGAAPSMFVPRTIPAGLYSAQEQWFVDEVWENQRLYPIVGWSSKLLLGDPSAFSDFSCTHTIDKDSWRIPDGFQKVYDWRLAKEAREIDSELAVLSDERLLQYSKHPNPFQKLASTSSSSRRGGGSGLAASVRAAVAGLGNSRSETAGHQDADETFNTSGDRSPRGARPAHAFPLPATTPAAAAPRASIEWLYSASWASGTDIFRCEPFLGGTMRRRLWVRVRKLVPASQLFQDAAGAAAGGEQESSNGALLRQRTLSTSSDDVVESPRHIAVGVMTPETEETDEK